MVFVVGRVISQVHSLASDISETLDIILIPPRMEELQEVNQPNLRTP